VLEPLPFPENSIDIPEFTNSIKDVLNDALEMFVQQDNDVLKMRETLGNEKGAFGAITGNQQILKIWDIISQKYPDLNCDQFFGFEPVDKQDYDSWPIYLGIIGCCAVMDIIGFQAEKKYFARLFFQAIKD